MGDIDRNSNEIMRDDPELRVQYLNVVLSEKLNQIKQLDVHLDKLRTVEMKQIELKKATLEKEIARVRYMIQNESAIDITPKEGGT